MAVVVLLWEFNNNRFHWLRGVTWPHPLSGYWPTLAYRPRPLPRRLCESWFLSLRKHFPAVCDVTVNRRGLPRSQGVSFCCRTRRRIWPWTRCQLASFAPNISIHRRMNATAALSGAGRQHRFPEAVPANTLHYRPCEPSRVVGGVPACPDAGPAADWLV